MTKTSRMEQIDQFPVLPLHFGTNTSISSLNECYSLNLFCLLDNRSTPLITATVVSTRPLSISHKYRLFFISDHSNILLKLYTGLVLTAPGLVLFNPVWSVCSVYNLILINVKSSVWICCMRIFTFWQQYLWIDFNPVCILCSNLNLI